MTQEIAKQPVEEFLEDLASHSPAPGSGSAAAVVAAIAAALVAKVCRLTVGKPKYAEVKLEMFKTLGLSEALRAKMMILAEADKKSFLKVIDSNGSMVSLQEAVASATTIAHAAEEIQCLAKIVAEKGNQNLSAEANLALDLARMAKRYALLIAKMNL
jgi:formiminotetrahydrofolate cyclodeaminase